MRPNSPYQQSLVSTRFRGTELIVYAVAKGKFNPYYNHDLNAFVKLGVLSFIGTDLPEDLLLVHERSDHYSLQPAAPMTIDGKYLLFRPFPSNLTS